MRARFLLCLLLLGSFLVPLAVAAAEPLPREIRFDRLTVDDGLSSSSVSGIVQDNEGFIWFATQSGLNRYDGYTIERYENDPFNRNSLSHNLIQTIFYEEEDVFWLGTYGGLNRFDPRTGTFEHYKHDPDNARSLSNNVVVAIARGSEGDLWVGTLDGLNRLHPDEGAFTRYLPSDSDAGTVPSKVIRCLHVDSDGTLWVGSYGGLSRYVAEEDRFETYSASSQSPARLPSDYVMTVLEDPMDPEVLWIGTWNGGVSRLNTRTNEIQTYRLPHNEIYTMMFDSAGRLWVGTWGNGLYVMDPATGSYRTMSSETGADTHSLSHDVVYSLLEDRSGIVWIGTNGGGVNKFVPWENRYETYVHDPEDPTSIAAGKVESIHIDEDGTGWFGVYNGGLNRLDPETGRFTSYRHDPTDPTSLSNDIVNDVHRDSRGDLWIGTNDGLNRYLPGREAFERIRAADAADSPPEDVVLEIEEGPFGNLWLGTHTGGVVVYDVENDTHRVLSHDPKDPHSLSDNLVRAVLHDSHGNIWVGTNHGLNRFDTATGEFTRYMHDVDEEGTPSSDNIRAIHQDSKGRLWIATSGGGVNRYHYDTDSFTFLSTADGLASNHVLNIVEDETGSLWFPTNRGISVYDPENGSFRTLRKSMGLVSNELTEAFARGPDGKLYFGSVRGVTVVETDSKAESAFTPPVVITSLEVMGSPREPERTDDGSLAPLILDYGESFFSVEFAALDYSSPEQNSYAYMLEGFDDEWLQAGSRHFASYTNLDPGTYTLRIKGAGSRGNWNEEALTLPVTVRPPWWQTPFAYVGYVVALAAALFLIVRRLRRQGARAEARLAEQERINRELDHKVRERTAEIERSRAAAERANYEKSLFLANMSHEIRTPLNGLVGMLSLLSQTELEERQREYLRYSRVSAENLNTLVNDLLDFERIEAGELRLTREPFSITETAQYIDRLFGESARDKDLYLEVSVDLDGCPESVRSDRGRFVQVLTNLVGNAVKYTEHGGIRVRITARDPEGAEQVAGGAKGGTTTNDHEPGCRDLVLYRIEVSDTGKGIPPESQKGIFDRFRQLDNGYTKAARGVGLGLSIVKQVVDTMGGTVDVESEPGRGSTFRVEVPLEPALPGEQTGHGDDGTQPDAAAAEAQPAQEHGGGTDTTPHAERAGEAAGSDARRTSILVCEDEAINRLYLVQHLRREGYEVEVANDGEESVRKVEEGDYDLVLMDLGMPGISGLEAARRIRSWEQKHERVAVPVIALTAHTYEEDIRECRDAGMNGFVSKPINEAQLRRTLTDWLG